MTESANLLKRSKLDSILDSAANQLACFGVGTSSLPEIAACMGLTRSALYYYAKSKEDLVYQVYRRSCELLVMIAGQARTSSPSALARLEQFVRSAILRPDIDIISLNELGMLEPSLQAELAKSHDIAVAAIAAILEEGMANKEIRPCNPDVSARAVISIVEQLCLVKAWTRTDAAISPMVGASPDLAELCDGTVDLMLNGWLSDRSRKIDLAIADFEQLIAPAARAFDREGQAKAKREELLVTASRLFNFQGVSSTTLDDIASALGITKRSIYHHVGDKQTLLSACHQRARNFTRYIYEDYQQRVTSGECPATAYANYLRGNALAHLRQDLAPIRLARGTAELREEDKLAYIDFVEWLAEATMTQLNLMAQASTLRPINVEAFSWAQIGSVNWLVTNVEAPPREKMIGLACEVIDVLMLGFRPIDKRLALSE